MSLMDLFTSFQGRISRRSWWFGTLILVCAGLAGSYLIDPGAFALDRPALPPPHLGRAAWTAILLFPALALALKRLQDRDQPDWVGQFLIAVALGSFAVLQLGYVQDPLQAKGADRLIFLAAALFQLWVVIDNGFLSGTPGPNRHGPDPLAPAGTMPHETIMAPPTRDAGRSWGANVRDGIVGLAALGAGLGWAASELDLNDRTKALVQRLTPPVRPDRERKTGRSARQEFAAGDKAAKAGKHEEAVSRFSRSIELYGPDSPAAAWAYRRRARAQSRLGRLDAALIDQTRAIELKPDEGGPRGERAHTLRALKRHAAALEDYETAIRLAPGNASHHIGRGITLRDLGRLEDAVTAFDDAIDAASKRHERLSRELSDWTPGAGPSKKILSLRQAREKRRWVAAYVHRGIARRKQGRYEEALGDFSEALRLDPDNRYALRNRGWLYEKQGRPKLALADYARAAKLRKPDAWLERALKRARKRLQ